MTHTQRYPSLLATVRLWRTVSAGPTDEHTAIRATLRAILALRDVAPERTGPEWREFRAWCDGWPGYVALLHTADPVLPYRPGRDSATRAGTLARGQWRGLPVLPRGVPADAVDTPHVSGYLWTVCAALAERATRRDATQAVVQDDTHRKVSHGKRRKRTDRRDEELRRKVRAALRRLAAGDAEWCALRKAFRARWGI